MCAPSLSTFGAVGGALRVCRLTGFPSLREVEPPVGYNTTHAVGSTCTSLRVLRPAPLAQPNVAAGGLRSHNC